MLYLRFIIIAFFVAVASGCNDTKQQKQLPEITAILKSRSANLKEGRIVTAKNLGIKKNQTLVVINSGYVGHIESGKFVSKQLAQEISLDYSASETGETFLLLIENENIVASLGVPGIVFQTNMEPYLNNAKIATPDKQVAYLTCINVEDTPVKQQWNYWSQNCKTIQLIKFDAK